jgi:hypothetical protein
MVRQLLGQQAILRAAAAAAQLRLVLLVRIAASAETAGQARTFILLGLVRRALVWVVSMLVAVLPGDNLESVRLVLAMAVQLRLQRQLLRQ